MADDSGIVWKDAPLVAVDLEGTGAQDREHEAILEIAIVPIVEAQPSLHAAYTTLINPGRPVPRRPWISPSLTDDALARAPALEEVAPALASRLGGQVIVGHNIGVDWRLLHRHCPGIRPLALIDTLRLARHLHSGEKRNGLTALLERHHLTDRVTELAPRSGPHRALWDAIGAALLLTSLTDHLVGADSVTYDELQRIAGFPINGEHQKICENPQQTSILDL